MNPPEQEKPTRTRQLLAIAAAGVILALGLHSWFAEGQTRPPQAANQSNAIELRQSNDPARFVRSTRTDGATPADSAIEIRVVDADGTPIEGAALSIQSPGALIAREPDLHLADATGTFQVSSEEAACRPGAQFLVSAPGFVSSFLGPKLESGVVTMERAVTQEVRVSDSVGAPVVGIRVSVCRDVSPYREAQLRAYGSDSSQGPDPQAYVRIQETDGNGVARFENLNPGDHLIRIVKEAYWMEGRSQIGKSVIVPTARHEIAVREVYGAAFRFPIEPLATMAIPRGEGLHRGFPVTGYTAEPGPARWLASRVEGEDGVLVGAARDGASEASVVVRALFEDSGWETFEIPLVPARGIQSALELRPTRPVGEKQGGEWSVIWADRPAGLEDFCPGGFWLYGEHGKPLVGGQHLVGKSLRIGETVRIPFCSMVVDEPSPFLFEALGLPRTIDIQAGVGTLTLKSTRDDLQACRLRFTDELGQDPDVVQSVVLTHACGWTGGYQVWGKLMAAQDPAMNTGFLCPPGRLDLSCEYRRKPFETSFEIRDVDGVQILDVVLPATEDS